MKYALPLLFLTLSSTLHAQNFLSWKYQDRYYSASLGVGSATYFGELNFSGKLNSSVTYLSAGLEARLYNHFGARLDIGFISLSGTDALAPSDSFQRQRNLSFESNNFHAYLAATYYIRPYRGDFHKRWKLDPYLVAGFGYLFYNPATVFDDQRYLLREAQTEGVSYRRWTPTIPFGVGIKCRLTEFINLNVEAIYNITFTDYLDDVSNTYGTSFDSSTAEFLSNRKEEVGVLNDTYYQMQPGTMRGNPSDDDHFLVLSVKVEFFVPNGLFKR